MKSFLSISGKIVLGLVTGMIIAVLIKNYSEDFANIVIFCLCTILIGLGAWAFGSFIWMLLECLWHGVRRK